jgi:hypothetical protein
MDGLPKIFGQKLGPKIEAQLGASPLRWQAGERKSGPAR